jgi:hypothetical protein
MEVEILTEIPPEWKSKQGTTYETRYLYTGFSRYDIERLVFSKIEKRGDQFFYHEVEMAEDCFPRSYHIEHVRVTVYSTSPRVWVEELSPDNLYFFREKQGQQAD